MGFTRKDYIEIGSQVGAPTLIDGGRKLLGIWGEDAMKLSSRGFGNERRDEFALQLDSIETRYREFGGSEGDIVTSGMIVREFVTGGKNWIRDLQSSALNAFEGTPIADSFFSEPAVGTSVKRLIRALTKYTGLAKTHSTELAPFGVDTEFLKSGTDILSGVESGREAQGKASVAMPTNAAELQYAKGVAYLMVKQLSRAAHRALNPERAKAYAPSRLFKTPHKTSTSSSPTGTGTAPSEKAPKA